MAVEDKFSGLESLPPLREVINKHNLFAKKKLGQNFLFDLNLTDRIARTAGNLINHTVIEIGPGPGGLTRALLANNAKNVVTIEYDERCLEPLKEIKSASNDRLEIIYSDALTIDYFEIVSLYAKGNPVKIIANLPYNIATALLFIWLDNLKLFSSMTLMFQKEVAERITAEKNTKAYGRLSILAQLLCETHREFDIKPEAFIPPPKITSTVITLIPRAKPLADFDIESLDVICRATFGQRRKMLSSSLKQVTDNPEKLLNKAGINPKARPQELDITQFAALSIAFSSIKTDS